MLLYVRAGVNFICDICYINLWLKIAVRSAIQPLSVKAGPLCLGGWWGWGGVRLFPGWGHLEKEHWGAEHREGCPGARTSLASFSLTQLGGDLQHANSAPLGSVLPEPGLLTCRRGGRAKNCPVHQRDRQRMKQEPLGGQGRSWVRNILVVIS